MRLPVPQDTWSEAWRRSYQFDRLEIDAVGNLKSGHEIGYARAYRERFCRTLDAVDRCAQDGSAVLDLAGGQGNFSLALAERGYRVTWNDLRGDLIPYVRAKHERGELRFAPGDAFGLTFSQPFDIVLATEVIEHVAHPDLFLERVTRLVRPGGSIVLTTPNGAYWRNRLPRFSECIDPARFEDVQFKPDADGHIFLLDSDEVRMLAERSGLVVRELSLFTNPFTRGALGLGRLLRVMPPSVVDLLEHMTAVANGLLCSRINMHLLTVLYRPTSP